MNKTKEQRVMALRYLYYVKGVSLVSDREYDELEREALKEAGLSSPLHKPGSDLAKDYSPEIRAIADAYKPKTNPNTPATAQ